MSTKPYCEVTLWQEKEMDNLRLCPLGVQTVALCQPDSRQVRPFKQALECVQVLVDFNIMAEYRSYTPETIA